MQLDKFPTDRSRGSRSSWFRGSVLGLKKSLHAKEEPAGGSRSPSRRPDTCSSRYSDFHRFSFTSRGPTPTEGSRASPSQSPSPELVPDHSGFQRKDYHAQEDRRSQRRVGRDPGARELSICGESIGDLYERSAVRTPRVPGDELWRGDKPKEEGGDEVGDKFDEKGLSMKVPTFLTKLTGASRDGFRAVPHLRPPETGFETKKKFTRKCSKFGTLASVTVPISAKQWLLQAIGLKDTEIREMFDQMESNPQLAAEYVREVRNEWEAMEARESKVPPEADYLVKDRVLLEKVRELIAKFIRSTQPEKPPSPEQQPSEKPGTIDQPPEGKPEEEPLEKEQPKEPRPESPCKDTEQTEGRNENLPSYIPQRDYVINKYLVQPELLGKSDCKSIYSPCDKRWYTVVFPALQPSKREDAQLLGEWLQHAMKKNCGEKPDGRFENIEEAFLLHCIAFLEVVRQVDIHCEERGNLLLHLWRQLLRIFNQVMVRAEPVLNNTEEELKRLREDLEAGKDRVEKIMTENNFFRSQYEIISKQLKDKEVAVMKIKRCRLCCTENMTPRSKEDYLVKLKKRSIGFRFNAAAVDPPSEEELKKMEAGRKKLEKDLKRQQDSERRRKEEEAADMARLEGEMDEMEMAAAEKRKRDVELQYAALELTAEATAAILKEEEDQKIRHVKTQTEDKMAWMGLRRSHSAPPGMFPRRRFEEVKEEPPKVAVAAEVKEGEGAAAAEAEPGGAEGEEGKKDAMSPGAWVEPKKETPTERLKVFETLAADAIGLLEKVPVEGALAEKMESILKKYCEMTGTVLDAKVKEKLTKVKPGVSFMVEPKPAESPRGGPGGPGSPGGPGEGPRPSEANGRPSELMQRKSRKSKGSKWGSQLKSYVPLGFAKMMKIYNPPKNVKFFNVRQLTKLISLVYTNKIVADAVDDSCNNERQTCCEFVYDFMLNQYGLKGLAESAIFGVFKTIKTLMTNKEIEKNPKVRMFSRFVGMDESMIYSEPDLYLYLKVLQKATSKVGVLLPSDQDDGILYLYAAQFSFICDEPNLVSYFGGQAAATSFIEKYIAKNAIVEKASPEIRKMTKESEVKKMDLDLLMEAILAVYPHKMDTIQEDRRKSIQVTKQVPKEKAIELENLFIAGDANQDGVLTFSEFKEIVLTAAPSLAAQSVLRMFRETLLLMPEGGDSISPAAFAQIAYNHDIESPPSVVFELLKKTWASVQNSIDPEKVAANKDEYQFVKEALLDLMQQKVDMNSAVQTFRQLVLNFCASEEEEPAEEEEQEEPDAMKQAAEPAPEEETDQQQ